MCKHKFKRVGKYLTIKGSYLYLYECEKCGRYDAFDEMIRLYNK